MIDPNLTTLTAGEVAAEAAWKAAWDVMVKNPTDATRAAYSEATKVREAEYEKRFTAR